jgi:peptidoglycan/xylan/chitin deacetylase (PgdA/CDA1 family)
MIRAKTSQFTLISLIISLLLVLSTIMVPRPVAANVAVSNLYGKTNTPNSTLNLRSCASTSCSILKRIPHGTVLSMTATSGDWFKTSYGGATGWVSSWYTVLQGTPASTISRGNTSRKMVSYTFDAGADVGYTTQILDHLKSNNIKASFGMTGKWANTNPTYVQRMVSEGHHTINHSWSHDSFTGFSTGKGAMSPARRTTELVSTNNKLYSLTNKSTKPYFRPPYGDYNASVLRDIGANGYGRNIMWSVDSFGWKGLTATEICNRVVGAMDAASYQGNGYIILFHVGAQSQDANALSCITSKLKARGFTFGTVPQVIAP